MALDSLKAKAEPWRNQQLSNNSGQAHHKKTDPQLQIVSKNRAAQHKRFIKPSFVSIVSNLTQQPLTAI